MPRVIISGGGSGGHIFPAIAIANELKRLNPETEILFVGAKDKIEMEKVPKAGYKIEGLWISGLHRKVNLKNILRNSLFPIKLLTSLWKARGIVKRFKPDVVVGVGGFASGPTLKMASRLGVPTLLQEQNSYAGMTNKLLAENVNKICVAYDKMDRFFPKEKIVLTGNPVRQDIIDLKTKSVEDYKHFGFDPNKKTIFLVGGSLGAKALNEAMRENRDIISKHPDIQIFWQMGKLYEKEFSISATAELPNVTAKAFIDRMDLAYTIADVFICRAGALTISELCITGKPVVLVPSTNVAEDHQTMNAKALVEKNAALLVKDKDAADSMLKVALQILEDSKKQEELKQNIKQLAKPNAANTIAKEVLNLIK